MKKLMAANWKMHKTRHEAKDTTKALVRLLEGRIPAGREVLVIPPFTALRTVCKKSDDLDGFFVGGQNFYPAESGAFTGEISPQMLLDLGASHVLAGHSERRHVFGESDEFIGRKVAYGLECGLTVILCVGELIEERKNGRVEDVLTAQLEAGLAGVPDDVAPERIVVAYEPVWAIGTGEVAGPEDIAAAHAFVRGRLVFRFGEKGNEIRILYGGSVKPENTSDIISLDNVDGVLVGGASLQAESFSAICLA